MHPFCTACLALPWLQEQIMHEARRVKAEAKARTLAENAASKGQHLASEAAKKGLSLCEAIKTSFRNEHTLVGLIAPPEEEEALTTSQFIQLFYTALMVDMGFACFNADTTGACGGELDTACANTGGGGRRGGGGGGDSSTGGGLFDFSQVSPVSAVITGAIAAVGIAIITGMCSYVFRWGK